MLLARRYYEAQWPLVMASARQFHLHPYFGTWAPHAKVVPGSSREEDRMRDGEADTASLITSRMREWGAQLLHADRDDFRVEKDKCAMQTFLERNNLPSPKALLISRDLAHFRRSLRGLAAAAHVRWPLFVKACHMTQGSLKSVRRLGSAVWLGDGSIGRWGELHRWLSEFYLKRANDADRPWTTESNLLTDAVSPGFMVQEGVPGWPGMDPKDANASLVLEVKVEVAWGRALFAIENTFGVIFLRDEREANGSPAAGSKWRAAMCMSNDGRQRTRLQPASTWGRLLRDGQLRCAWELAERAARAIGADAVRIDIFLLPASEGAGGHGHAHLCTINEISLSSAMWLEQHQPFLSRLWLEPHMTKEYRTRAPVNRSHGATAIWSRDGGLRAATPVHEQSRSDWADGGRPRLDRSEEWWWWCGPCPNGSGAMEANFIACDKPKVRAHAPAPIHVPMLTPLPLTPT